MYLIKKTYTVLYDHKQYEKGHIETWYNGKNFAHREIDNWAREDAYKRKLYVERKIEKDKQWEAKFHKDFWKIEYEIVEL